MSAPHTTGLGPQCWRCRRRRVKCDSTPKACQRCARDGIECPGYVKPLKWNHSGTSNFSGAKLQQKPSTSSEEPLLPPAPSSTGSERRDALALELVRYYNEHLVAPGTPAQRPFTRRFLPAELLAIFPSALKHIWIVIVKTRQIGRTSTDPLLQPELCYYRGHALTDLQKLLSDVEHTATDPWASALHSVLFVMGADMQLCEDYWTSHLEAARKIIALRGGLGICLGGNNMKNNIPLIEYMYADIVTASACNAWLLHCPAMRSQFEYINLLPKLESHLMSSGHPFPCQMLKAVVLTNILRVSLRRPLVEFEADATLSHNINFDCIMSSINNFDAHSWAVRMSNLDRTLPQRSCEELDQGSISSLASLANCYKSAALLYLLLAAQPSKHSQLIQSSKGVLAENLHNLFSVANVDPNGPLGTQLWKFSVWPLIVSVYVKAAWNVGENFFEDLEDFEEDLARLHSIALALASRRLMIAIKFLNGIRTKVSAQTEGSWRWDDAFDTRCAFVV